MTLLFSLCLVRVCSASVHVPTTCHFGFASDSYVSFSSSKIFDSVSRESGFWFFNDYGFQIVNGNVSISNYFVGDQLTFSLDASDSCEVDVYVSSLGEPSTVWVNDVESDDYTFNESTTLLGFEVDEGLYVFVVSWSLTTQEMTGFFFVAILLMVLIGIPLLLLISKKR